MLAQALRRSGPYMCCAALPAVLLFAPASYGAEEFPGPFEATYTLYSTGTRIATMQRRLSRSEDGRYLYESKTDAAGLLALFRKDHITERSVWEFAESGPRSRSYLYERSGGSADRTVQVSFDWASGFITNTVNGSTWQMPLQPEMMDKLLYQLAIMFDLESGKESLHYIIADGGKTKIYRFYRLGEEVIDTPLGRLRTVKLQRDKPNSRRDSTLWCAIGLHFLPVKVENVEKSGKVTTAVISGLQGFDAAGIALLRERTRAMAPSQSSLSAVSSSSTDM